MLLRRWRNTLGRTMWDFAGGPADGERYLVIGLGTGQAADLAVPYDEDELIAHGPLLSDDGAAWLGTAALLRAPGPDTARAILTPGRYAAVEVYAWRYGGRALTSARVRTGREEERRGPPYGVRALNRPLRRFVAGAEGSLQDEGDRPR